MVTELQQALGQGQGDAALQGAPMAPRRLGNRQLEQGQRRLGPLPHLPQLGLEPGSDPLQCRENAPLQLLQPVQDRSQPLEIRQLEREQAPEEQGLVQQGPAAENPHVHARARQQLQRRRAPAEQPLGPGQDELQVPTKLAHLALGPLQHPETGPRRFLGPRAVACNQRQPAGNPVATRRLPPGRHLTQAMQGRPQMIPRDLGLLGLEIATRQPLMRPADPPQIPELLPDLPRPTEQVEPPRGLAQAAEHAAIPPVQAPQGRQGEITGGAGVDQRLQRPPRRRPVTQPPLQIRGCQARLQLLLGRDARRGIPAPQQGQPLQPLRLGPLHARSSPLSNLPTRDGVRNNTLAQPILCAPVGLGG